MQSSDDHNRNESEFDFSCSVYENIFDSSHKAGDVAIGSIIPQNVNALADICFTVAPDKISLSDIVFFDTETTGLGTGASTAAFLIGTGYFENDRFILKQFLMNDYHQESDMLSSLNSILSNHKAVVSYNGKSYDTHIVNSRSILNRIPRLLESKLQLDLLHSARRLYKNRLNSCSMRSIEENILNLQRVDDIPGSEIPEIFFNYLKYKDKEMLSKVIEHNAQDIISMTAIAFKLIEAYENPQNLLHKEDIFSQGVIFEKLNFPQNAKLCYNVLGIYPPAVERLAHIARASGDYDEAIGHFTHLSRIHQFDPSADVELAKIYEHKMKDFNMALLFTNRALEKVSLFLSSASQEAKEDLKKRKARLINKLNTNRKE